MNNLIEYTRGCWRDEEGQDLVEYSLLLAFIAMALIVLLGGIRSSTSGIWTSVNSTIISANSSAS